MFRIYNNNYYINITAIIQPTGQHIIQFIKQNFKKLLLMVISYVDLYQLLEKRLQGFNIKNLVCRPKLKTNCQNSHLSRILNYGLVGKTKKKMSFYKCVMMRLLNRLLLQTYFTITTITNDIIIVFLDGMQGDRALLPSSPLCNNINSMNICNQHKFIS